jgi:hypothetical protein
LIPQFNKIMQILGTAVLCAAIALGALALFAPSAHAHSGTGTFATFSTGETISASKLNGNFTHIHNTFTGGITNTHLSSSAAISHSKLAQPTLVAKAVGKVTVSCDGALGTACTINSIANVTSIVGAGTAGVYNVTLNHTPTATTFGAIVTSHVSDVNCQITGFSTAAPHFVVRCYNGGATTNSFFTILAFGT